MVGHYKASKLDGAGKEKREEKKKRRRSDAGKKKTKKWILAVIVAMPTKGRFRAVGLGSRPPTGKKSFWIFLQTATQDARLIRWRPDWTFALIFCFDLIEFLVGLNLMVGVGEGGARAGNNLDGSPAGTRTRARSRRA